MKMKKEKKNMLVPVSLEPTIYWLLVGRFNQLSCQDYNLKNIRQIRLVLAILLVLHSIGQTYLYLYFRLIFTNLRIAQLVKVSVW